MSPYGSGTADLPRFCGWRDISADSYCCIFLSSICADGDITGRRRVTGGVPATLLSH